MKKIIQILSLLFFVGVYAQESDEVKVEKPFNSWSLELNAGMNKPVKPFSPGFYSSNTNKFLHISSSFSHYDFGARYMLNNMFGLKLAVGYDLIKNQSNNNSLPFENKLISANFQGVVNMGQLMNFQSFTKRLSILAHAGLQTSVFSVPGNDPEYNGGFMVGVTPMVKLSRSLALTADFTAINYVRQHFNWDGFKYASKSENLSGLLYNTSLGLTVYFGDKEKQHADWYSIADKEDSSKKELEAAQKRIDEIESKMQDTDRDGVPDYLDTESNTPSGVAVNTKGQFIDINNNNVPDELEPRVKDGNDSASVKEGNDGASTSSYVNVVRELLANKAVNVFFDIDIDQPNAGSTNNVYQLIQFLRDNPDINVKLEGYADVTGDEAENQDLSSRRVQNVQQILLDSGVKASQLQISAEGVDVSYGKALGLARRVSAILIN